MESSSYKSWLQAWILVRDKVSEDITTFSQFDSMLGIDKYGYSLNDMLYELEMALHNEGLEDLYFMEQRAELAHWIYTYFTDETELNLANYRAFEAESVCELDDIDRAELLIKELIQLYPKSSIGYVIWADFYWSSDWSYQYGENYEKAESIYHRALSIKGLNDYVAIEGNLKAMKKSTLKKELGLNNID